jgi:hypothetical protein
MGKTQQTSGTTRGIATDKDKGGAGKEKEKKIPQARNDGPPGLAGLHKITQLREALQRSQ